MWFQQIKETLRNQKKILSATSLIAALVILVSVSYGYVFQGIVSQKADAFLTNNLNQNETAVNQMIASCDTLCSQMYTELSIRKLMNEDLDVYEFQTYYPQLKRYRTVDSDIEALYLYNARQQKVYSTSGTLSFGEHSREDFPDGALWEYLRQPAYSYASQPVPRTIPVENIWAYDGKTELPVFSFFYTPAVRGNYIDYNTIVVNYSYQKLIREFAYFSSDAYGDGSVLILSGDTVIFSTDPEQPLGVSAGEVFNPQGLRFLRDDRVQKGTRCRINGESKYILKRRLDNLDWTLVTVVPSRYITRENSICVLLTVLLLGVVVLVGIGSAITASGYTKRQKQQEIEELTRYYSQQDFLMELFHGWRRYDVAELSQRLEEFGSSLGVQGNFHMIIGKIDHYYDYFNQFQKSDRAELNRKIIQMVSRYYADAPVKIEGCNMLNEERDGEFVWLLQEEAGLDFKAFEDRWYACFETIREKTGRQFSLIISKPFHSMESVAFLYKSLSEEITIRRVFDGYGLFIHEMGLRTEPYSYPEKEEKAMMDCLLMGDYPGLRENFERIVDLTRYRGEYEVESTFTQLSYSYYRNVQIILRNHQIAVPSGMLMPYITFEFVERIDDVRRIFYNAFDGLERILQEKRANRQKELSDRIVEYIRQHFSDPDLSRQSIADAFHVSYSTVGVAIKSRLPGGLSNYVQELRLESAKELLAFGSDPIESVAAQCGFASYIHFHKTFKKNTGTTPGDYRKEKRPS